MFAYGCDQIGENDIHLFSIRQGNAVIQGGYLIYIINSSGYTERGNRVVERKITKRPKFEPQAHVYLKGPPKARESMTHIDGMDQCGSVKVPRIMTTTSTVTEEGFSVINGSSHLIEDCTVNTPLQETAEYF
jgi:hypothetical protein